MRLCLPTLALLGCAASVAAVGAFAEPLSARAAEQALQRGALAWDVREAGALLPGALRLDAATLERWLADGDLAALQHGVSAAGLDLSRDVVVYGEPGDRRAQAAVEVLGAVASGRLHWLVGGAAEWQALGLPTQAGPSARLPVPQRLAARAVADAPMADRARREGFVASAGAAQQPLAALQQ